MITEADAKAKILRVGFASQKEKFIEGWSFDFSGIDVPLCCVVDGELTEFAGYPIAELETISEMYWGLDT